MRKWTAEAIGTFMLVFAGTGAIVVDDLSHGAVTHVGVSLVFGLVVMTMIYAIGDVSGAHLNPAVTLGFTIAGKMKIGEAAPYVASQLIGALAASAAVAALFDHPTLGATLPAGSHAQAFLLEAILTAILMFVILNVSVDAKETGIMAGAAVGSVIALAALLGGPISGASMNPARSLAPAMVSGALSGLWIYLAAPLLGAAVGVVMFRLVREPAPQPQPNRS